MLEKLNPIYFDEIYYLMQMSFTPDEYRTYLEQKALLDLSYYQIYVSLDKQENRIQAFIAIFEFECIVCIDHFAVSPKYRNRGIGSRVLQELMTMLNKMICLEVELPNDELSRRRIAFYERNHFFLNPYSYTLPPISKGRKSIPLYIMTSQRTITQEEFLLLKEFMYTALYHQKVIEPIQDV
ncbi:MAG: GNAT family N-acetyltransferase [Prevotella sp.]|nr:GNAT family N-acetyltransferase [Staphylococcus sp.]MCM1350391.1 GNAT family N-acetyltransferase [Prevotella sp.]